ncbi:hypothetical protein AVEN_117671-1 [Araneus ventricosus]|uniref:Uncharacterized protein n=1 Tax=Araneus ventricosus TaxID=182803 RepID=A0A4Y2VK91_ARAVE|nr:hypothetical protein AVEN_117671-1 [Araneus ventricosus]
MCLFRSACETKHFCDHSRQSCKYGLQASFCHLLHCLRRCTSSALENRCPLAISSSDEKVTSHHNLTFQFFYSQLIRRDQVNKLAVKELECEISISKFRRELRVVADHDGAPKTCLPLNGKL